MKQKTLTLLLALLASASITFAETYSGTCGDNLTWTLRTEDGILNISGEGQMTNYSDNSYAPWYAYRYSIAYVIIGNNMTKIGNYAFCDCSNLISVTIGENVTTIGNHAFHNCSGLPTVIIPNSVESIGGYVFQSCSSLTSVSIGESVTSIGEHTFYGCSKLSSIVWNAKQCQNFNMSNSPFHYTVDYNSYKFDIRPQITSFSFGDKVEYIPSYLCTGMSNLTSVTIPSSVTSFGNYAFSGCSSLTSVVWNAMRCNDFSLNNTPFYYHHDKYGNYNFDIRIQISSFTFGDKVEIIPAYLCSGMPNLTSVTIPNSVTIIGENAFCDCTYLEDIIIGSGIVSNGIGQSVFASCPYLLRVMCKTTYPPVINADVFENCGVLGGIDLYVPEESVQRYKKADVWSEFNIIGKDLGTDDPTNPTTDQFTITWQDEDGNVIKTDKIEYGTIPTFTGTTPTKEATNEYTYEFAGWLPTIKAATEDVRYTTFFERNKTETPVYTVNINGENCSLNINNQYPEGTVITIEAVADECFEFQQWSDGNKDNPRTVTVTKDMNLTAEFNKLRYTVTGQTETGTGGKVQIIKK